MCKRLKIKKMTMKKGNDTGAFLRVVLLAAALTAFGSLSAQVKDADFDQDAACPGWSSPTDFIMGPYSGQGGVVPGSGSKVCPNVMTGEIGANLTTSYSATQLNTESCGSCSSTNYSQGTLPNRDRQFLIMTNTTGTDPNTDNHLPYVPTNFNTNDTTPGVVNTHLTSSIRIGDACANGGNYGISALYYKMKVGAQNALLYIYYAIVAEAPTHGMKGNPTFIIRVMRKNAAQQWAQISDQYAYYITTTPMSNASTAPCPNMTAITPQPLEVQGWHSAQGGNVYYKDWEKVALNLSPLYGDSVRIDVIIYDCTANYHYAYAYLCGECRPMVIPSTGCPAGRSQDVTVLNAPRGLRSYFWQQSEFGVVDPPINVTQPDYDYITFRDLSSHTADSTEAAGAQSYHVQANDFKIYKRRTPQGTTITLTPPEVGHQQTFRCRMISALDPDKPFVSYMYANVTNIKPTMAIDSTLMCGGDVMLTNTSNVPGGQVQIAQDSTTWKFYNTSNPNASTQMIDTVHHGNVANVHFESDSTRYVLVRSYAEVEVGQDACYSEEVYPIKPKMNPKTGMHITRKNICLDSTTTLYDTTTIYVDENHPKYARWWIRRKATAPEDNYTLLDTIWHSQSLSISNFTHTKEPVELWVRNGQYYTNPTNNLDTTWCKTAAYDTVKVFTHPDIDMEGDSIVCKGTKTHITATALDIDSCKYHWYTTLYGTNAISDSSLLEVTPVNDTTTYYVKVTSPMNCDAWDSARAFLITPALEIRPADGKICPDDEVKLIGKNAASYTWTANPPDPTLDGQDSADIITVSPDTTTVYTMVGHGTNGCDATPLTQKVTVYPYAIPKIRSNPPMVDTDDPTVTLYNESTYSVNATWTFENGDVLTGNEVEHTFEEATGQDSVYLTLTPVNELDCPSVPRRFGIPVNLYTIWLPTIFTPGSEDDNAVFRMYTINDYELFHIYIYNRRGELVFESTDPKFVWDGTCNGVACSQGAYVYICRYRKPGMLTLAEKYGTVTMIR